MANSTKITAAHRQRHAIVYVRQSTPGQVERHRESTARQYALAERARELGWAPDQVHVIDDDLGISGSVVSLAKRSGFAHLTTEVALGHVGIVLGLEVSRLARSNADWYRLLDLCAVTDTLIGDSDGVYHPALFNDRLILGLKGTMSEAELHTLRARLDGGIRNKAARGALRRGLPVGFVYGDTDGEVRFHPDAAVTGAIRAVFDRFSELGSVRRVWLWFRAEGLSFPLQQHGRAIQWLMPSYRSILRVLTNPVYAGAYTFGKTRRERYVDADGFLKQRSRELPITDWAVLIRDHHAGFIDWVTFEANQMRIEANTRVQPYQAGGAVREGTALLQGLAVCGHCGRRLHTRYRGRNSAPGYYCDGRDVANGRGLYCLTVGGVAIDQAVAGAFLDAVTPAAVDATVRTVEQLHTHQDVALAQWRLAVERARYEAERAERRYRLVEPEHRLVARGLEAEWETRLRELATAEAELRSREQHPPPILRAEQRERLQALGADLRQVWTAPTTTDRDRKELLRTLIEDVTLVVRRAESCAHVTLRWRGGTLTTLDVALPRSHSGGLRTDEETLDLLPRLAAHYSDADIACIFNKQGRTTAKGERFTADQVGSLRRSHKIPRYQPPVDAPAGEVVSVRHAARILGLVPSTLHRALNDGFIAGERPTPGAPWRIRITDELRAKFVDEATPDYLPMLETTLRLGVSRQTVLQRVKRGELHAVHVNRGRRKGLRIKVIDTHPSLL
jgi:DNA invertase Pin-like site-specific DNA recombinase